MQALLSFPFVAFLMPMALPLLTHVQPTGYDKSGLLCQALQPYVTEAATLCDRGFNRT